MPCSGDWYMRAQALTAQSSCYKLTALGACGLRGSRMVDPAHTLVASAVQPDLKAAAPNV